MRHHRTAEQFEQLAAFAWNRYMAATTDKAASWWLYYHYLAEWSILV